MKKNIFFCIMRILFSSILFSWIFLCFIFSDKVLIASGVFFAMIFLFIFIWSVLFLLTKQTKKKQIRNWKKVKRLIRATNVFLYLWGWMLFFLSPEAFKDLKLEG